MEDSPLPIPAYRRPPEQHDTDVFVIPAFNTAFIDDAAYSYARFLPQEVHRNNFCHFSSEETLTNQAEEAVPWKTILQDPVNAFRNVKNAVRRESASSIADSILDSALQDKVTGGYLGDVVEIFRNPLFSSRNALCALMDCAAAPAADVDECSGYVDDIGPLKDIEQEDENECDSLYRRTLKLASSPYTAARNLLSSILATVKSAQQVNTQSTSNLPLPHTRTLEKERENCETSLWEIVSTFSQFPVVFARDFVTRGQVPGCGDETKALAGQLGEQAKEYASIGQFSYIKTSFVGATFQLFGCVGKSPAGVILSKRATPPSDRQEPQRQHGMVFRIAA